MGQTEKPAIISRRYPGRVGGEAGSLKAIKWAAGILSLAIVVSILSGFFLPIGLSFSAFYILGTILAFVITHGIEKERLFDMAEESNRFWYGTYYEFKVPRKWPLVNIARRIIASLETQGFSVSKINVRGYQIGIDSPYRGIMMGMRIEPGHRQIYFLVVEEEMLFGQFPSQEAAAIVVTPIDKSFNLEKDPVTVLVAKVLWNQEVMNLRKNLPQTLSDHDLMGLPSKQSALRVDPKYHWQG
jgi:hypothetical protein